MGIYITVSRSDNTEEAVRQSLACMFLNASCGNRGAPKVLCSDLPRVSSLHVQL